MKILKHKNLMGLIFSALLAMPLLGIVARCGYVIANKNAYQSYYGETINQQEIKVLQNENDIINKEVYYRNAQSITTGTQETTTAYFTNIEVVENIDTNLTTENVLQAVKMVITTYNYQSETVLYDNNNNSLGTLSSNNGQLVIKIFVNQLNGSDLIRNQNFYTIEYNNYSYLDNVFEYSVNKFVSENNLGQINMFSWFTNLFLSDNATNNLYVGFANWYMNYAMLISCMHLLFLVLMWFVNYSRRLLDRGMNYDW